MRPPLTLVELSADPLRNRGWIVPVSHRVGVVHRELTRGMAQAYTMAPKAKDLKLLRVVVREDFTLSRCQTFLRDLHAAMDFLTLIPKVRFPPVFPRHVLTRRGGKAATEAIADARSAAKGEGQEKKGGKTYHHRPHGHKTNSKGHVHIDEKHSLQGKHGKTHGPC